MGETVDLVRQGQVDVGIISQTSLPDSLVFYPWRTYEAYLLLPAGHRLLRGGRPPFQELVNYSTVMQYPLIAPERGDPAYTRISQALEQLGLPFNVAFEVGTIETVKHYVELGLGLAVVSGICLTREDQGKLEAIEIPKEFGGTSIYGRCCAVTSASRCPCSASGPSSASASLPTHPRRVRRLRGPHLSRWPRPGAVPPYWPCS